MTTEDTITQEQRSQLWDLMVLAVQRLSERGERPTTAEILAECRIIISEFRLSGIRIPKKAIALQPWIEIAEELLRAVCPSHLTKTGWQTNATLPRENPNLLVSGNEAWQEAIERARKQHGHQNQLKAIARKMLETTLRWRVGKNGGMILFDGRMVRVQDLIPNAFSESVWENGFPQKVLHLVQTELEDTTSELLIRVNASIESLVRIFLENYVPQGESFLSPIVAIAEEGLLNLYRLAIQLASGSSPNAVLQVGFGGSVENGDPLNEVNIRLLSYVLPPIQLLESLYNSKLVRPEQLSNFKIRFFVAHQSAHFVNDMPLDELWATSIARFAFAKAFLEWRGTRSEIFNSISWDFERSWFENQATLEYIQNSGQKIQSGAGMNGDVRISDLVLWLLERALNHVQFEIGTDPRSLIPNLKAKACQYMAVHPILFFDILNTQTPVFSSFEHTFPLDFVLTFGGTPEAKFYNGRLLLAEGQEGPHQIMIFVRIGANPPVYYSHPDGDLTVRNIAKGQRKKLAPTVLDELRYLEADLKSKDLDWDDGFVLWIRRWVAALPSDPTPGDHLAHEVAMAASLGSQAAQRCLDVISQLSAEAVVVEKLFAVLAKAHRELMGYSEEE